VGPEAHCNHWMLLRVCSNLVRARARCRTRTCTVLVKSCGFILNISCSQLDVICVCLCIVRCKVFLRPVRSRLLFFKLKLHSSICCAFVVSFRFGTDLLYNLFLICCINFQFALVLLPLSVQHVVDTTNRSKWCLGFVRGHFVLTTMIMVVFT